MLLKDIFWFQNFHRYSFPSNGSMPGPELKGGQDSGHRAQITDLAIHPGTAACLTASLDGSCRLWHTNGGIINQVDWGRRLGRCLTGYACGSFSCSLHPPSLLQHRPQFSNAGLQVVRAPGSHAAVGIQMGPTFIKEISTDGMYTLLFFLSTLSSGSRHPPSSAPFREQYI